MKFNVMHLIVKLPIGGMENMLYKVVKNYNRELFNPLVCCIKEGGYFAEKLKEEGIKVYILNRMHRHQFDFKAISEIIRILNYENIHILRTHAYHANLYGRIAAKIAKTPVVISSSHSVYENFKKPKFHRRLFNFFLSNFCDAIVAVSKTVAKDIERFDKVSKDKIKVIYNGIELDRFIINKNKDETRSLFRLPKEKILIGTLGRLDRPKGIEYLIKAVEGLNLSLVIGGDGPLRKELEDLAKALNIDVYFLGKIEPEKVPLFLNCLDIFCFPSLWEGMPVTVIEAMAVGLPIIASDLEPLKEVLADCGIYFPKGDTKKLRELILSLIDNEKERLLLGKKAQDRAKIFSIKNTVNQYENLFLEIYRRKYEKA